MSSKRVPVMPRTPLKTKEPSAMPLVVRLDRSAVPWRRSKVRPLPSSVPLTLPKCTEVEPLPTTVSLPPRPSKSVCQLRPNTGSTT